MDLSLLDLTDYEQKAYIAAIQHGKASAAQLSNTSEVPYGRIYDVLSALENKGLIEVIPEPTKHYIPADPKALKEMLDNKRTQLESISEHLDDLGSLYESRTQQVVSIARGKANFTRMIKQMPDSAEYSYSIKYTADTKPQWLRDSKAMRERGVERKTLVRLSEDTEKNISTWRSTGEDMRAFPNQGVAISMNQDAILIGLIKSNTTLMIRDPAFTDIMRRLFDAAWDSCSPNL